MKWYYVLVRHSHNALLDKKKFPFPAIEEVPVLQAIYDTHLSGESVVRIETSPRADVPPMGFIILTSIPDFHAPDRCNMVSGEFVEHERDHRLHVVPTLRSKISADPERKEQLVAQYKASQEKADGMSLDNYIFLPKVGLFPEMTQWAKEIIEHILDLPHTAEEDILKGNTVIGVSHGGIVEPVAALASHLIGKESTIENFIFEGLAQCPVINGKPLDNCAAIKITIEDGKITEVQHLARPQV